LGLDGVVWKLLGRQQVLSLFVGIEALSWNATFQGETNEFLGRNQD
jgi:hypothetical protein